MSRKLRISHIIVHPVLVWDDGEELTQGPQVEPMRLVPSALAGLADQMRSDVAELERQVDPEGQEIADTL